MEIENETTPDELSANEKRSLALCGRPKSPEHRAKISAALKAKVLDGTLPAMQEEVRDKQKATKKKQAEAGLLRKQAQERRARQNVPGFQERRAARWHQTLLERYGTTNLNNVPGVIEKANAKRSLTMSEKISLGQVTNDWGKFKRGWHDSPIAGLQWYQSGWELVRMEFLDQVTNSWTKEHGIRIPYRDLKDQLRHYVPDFLVHADGCTRIEEVKGYKTASFPCKVKAAKEWCEQRGWDFVVIDTLKMCSL